MARASWEESYEGKRGPRGRFDPLPPELLCAEAFDRFFVVLELAAEREGDEGGKG